ncbi:hypothetical protein OIE68_45935 [Nocardia vinacea]|uniref:hypothetical protein n=1 Tax=Nocardia vinacea TaxID=96468 RepID=UPI002E13C299|nr:hypothetical protein OIE68_45935 [Nocardia vinacea]
MARVPWAALSGEDVEAVVANLLYNEHQRAWRIRPSQGDYGIDVIVPRDVGGSTVWDVYQIKKFALNLDDSQKRQVEKSFRRLMIGLVRRGFPLGDWYLVMPLDPTTDNLSWFEKMPDTVIDDMFAENPKLAISAEERDKPLTIDEQAIIRAWRQAPGRIIEWHGLNYCEAMIAKHWYVQDYYLNGGRERLKNAVADVAKILQRDITLRDNDSETSVLTPAEIREHLVRVQGALDGDPHFRYGVSLDPHRPELREERDLLAAAQEIASDGSCLTFRIYQRFDESLNERPIPIRLVYAFEDPGFDQRAFDRWRKYGTPATFPASVDVDLPGGLALTGTASVVRVSAARNRRYEIRLRVSAPTGPVGREHLFKMTSTTGPDGTGVWTRGIDASGLITTEGLIDRSGEHGHLSFTLRDTTGLEAAVVLPAMEFLASMTHPNTLQLGEKYGPFHDFHQIPVGQQLIHPQGLKYLRALATLQTHTTTPILVPELTNLTVTDFRNVISAASLIEEPVVVGTWEPFECDVTNGDLDLDDHYQMAFDSELITEIGSQKVTIPGVVTTTMMSARMEDLSDGRARVLPHLNATAHRTYHPDGSIPAGTHLPLVAAARPASDAAEGDFGASDVAQDADGSTPS